MNLIKFRRSSLVVALAVCLFNAWLVPVFGPANVLALRETRFEQSEVWLHQPTRSHHALGLT